ncbi:unnamed protein product [Owenia fusiformis]|uniref:Uncharacterized protein n=1 Tax=Owenia fusiformis TaxID=6347 RepID=A0A8J1XV53_OWEFU|nr:unnamed protein product [Owenia fusiformis]
MTIGVKSKVCLLGGVALSLAGYIFLNTQGVWAFIVATVLGICGVGCLDILRLEVGESLTLRSVLGLYMLHRIFGILGLWAYRSMLKTDPKQAQDKLLMKLINTNKNTKYGIDHNFSMIKSPEDFIEQHPVTKYDHYEEYFDRVIAGETDVIVANSTPTYIVLTSGTTGHNKKYPVSNSGANKIGGLEIFKTFLAANYILRKTLSPELKLLKTLDVNVIQDPIYTDRGIPMGGLAGRFKMSTPGTAAPRMVLDVSTQDEALYLYALYGMKERKLNHIMIPLASVGLKFFELIESKWQHLCDDIEMGTIWKDLDIDSKIREELEKQLKGDKIRANELRKEFNKGIEGIGPRIWQHLPMIMMISTGSFKIYGDIVKERYIGEQIPIVSHAHAASEGIMAQNMTPGQSYSQFTLNSGMFYEFLPVDDENAKPLRVHQIEVGKCYELLVTNNYGLYRYRFGDVIKIVGYNNKMPVYEFQYRAGQMLNVVWEKTPEGTFMNSVVNTVNQLKGVRIVDYTATENINLSKLRGAVTTARHYVLFIEVTKDKEEVKLTDDELKKFDQSLCEEFPFYKVMRDDGKIQPMEALQVKTQTFDNLRRLMLRSNKKTTELQFKMPRVQRQERYLQFLLDNLL